MASLLTAIGIQNNIINNALASSPVSPELGQTWMRKWDISVTAGDVGKAGQALDLSALHCVFTVKTSINGLSHLGLQVYNMSPKTEGLILKKGYKVTIKAGYQNSRYGIIFDGHIIQAFVNRHNGTDFIAEIYAINNPFLAYQNFVNSNMAAGSDPRKILNFIGSNADTTFRVGQVSESVNRQQLPRGQVFFGDPNDIIDDITFFDDTFAVYNDKGSIDIISFNDPVPDNMAIELSPRNGLIGAPIYSDDGIIIPMLLDSRVRINSLIKIDNSLILRQEMNYDFNKGLGNTAQMLNFEQSGEYKVASIVHEGDTHGNVWKTEVIGFSSNRGIVAIQQGQVFK